MEINTSTANLEALAAEVKAAMSAAFDSLTAFAAVTTELHNSTRAARSNSDEGEWSIEKWRANEIRSANYDLAYPLARAVERIRSNITDELENIERGITERSRELADLDERQADLMRSKAIGENRRALATAERIESDFFLIDAKTTEAGKGKSKSFKATIVFLLNGSVYQTETAFDGKTKEYAGYEWHLSQLGFRFIDRKSNCWTDLCTAEMTTEEIGKAAHVYDSIHAALRKQIGPVVVPTTEAATAA